MIEFLAIAALAVAAPQDAEDVQRPDWVVRPAADMEVVYPMFARALELAGDVVLDCAGDPAGRLVDCGVVSATPEGLGFERAAKTIAQTGRVQPRNGHEHRYQFRVPFSLAEFDYPEPAPFDGPTPSAQALELGRALTKRMDFTTMISETIPVVDLDGDRLIRVEGWVREIFPSSERLIEIVGVVFARRFSESELKDLIAGRPTSAVDRWPSDVEILAEAVDLFDWRMATGQLRERYCSEYDCRQP